MPNVDTSAPLVTNSDAAMWRQDHASACRYIEALEADVSKLREYIDAGNAAYHKLWVDYEEATRRAAIYQAELARLREKLAEKESSIEALLAERETWAPVIEAAKTLRFTQDYDDTEEALEALDAAIDAALKEGNDEQNTTQA